MQNVIEFLKTLPENERHEWWFFFKIMAIRFSESGFYENLLDLYADNFENYSDIDLTDSTKI